MATRSTNLRQINYDAVAKNVRRMIGIDVAEMFIAAAKEANNRTSKQLIALGQAFEASLTDKSKTLAINERIGKAAQKAVVDSYLGYRRSGGPSGYRSNQAAPRERYAGGVLQGALQDASFVETSATSIEMINVAVLNRRAKQWARLNFGAGALGAASPGSRHFPLRISNLVVASLGLEAAPRPSFLIPRGYFLHEAHNAGRTGRDAFYLAGDGPTPKARATEMMMTRGIRAEHFLDNGIAVIAERLGPEYIEYVKDLVATGVSNVKTTSAVATNAKVVKKPRIPRSTLPAATRHR